jgi:hypothetical protein
LGGRRTVLVTVSILVAIALSAVAFVRLTDVPLFLVYASWIGPLVVLIPYAFSSAGNRPYGAGTLAAALLLPTVTAVWVLWLVVIHAH